MPILTFLTDQIHPSSLSSGLNISITKSWASSRTLRSAKVHGTSFRRKDDLLFSYPRFSLVTTSTDFLLCQYQHTGPESSSSYSQIDGIWDNTLNYKNLMSTTVLCCRPHLLLFLPLDWLPILPSPSSSLLSSSSQDEKGNLIEFSSIQFRVISGLPRHWGGLQYTLQW